MEEDILNYLYQLSCFMGHPVYSFIYRRRGFNSPICPIVTFNRNSEHNI